MSSGLPIRGERSNMASASAAQQQLVGHLQNVQQNPGTPLDLPILESYELYLQSPGVIKDTDTLQQTFFLMAQTLPSLQQDPSPLVKVALKVAEPLSYDHIASVDLLPGLSPEAVPFHGLILSLLDKAANANDTARLASQPEVIRALVVLWLSAPNIGTSEQAGDLLLRFLRFSKNRPASLDQETATKYGEGPMWKRLFGDKDIYELFFGICTLNPKLKLLDLTKNERTLAQSRLMDWLPKVGALDWDTILRSQHPTVSQKYGLSPEDGLLPFAVSKMVDVDDDILMHIRLLEFYRQLLETVRQPAAGSNVSKSLEFLTNTGGIHEKAVSYWLKPEMHDSLDSSFLSKPSAQYVGSWASTHPSSFNYGSHVANAIRDRLNDNLSKLSANQWARGMSPENDLIVLADLPPTFFVDLNSVTPGHFNAYPLSRVPSKFTNADALNTLARVFHNVRVKEEIVFPPPETALTGSSDASSPLNQSAARAAFLLYLASNPTLFTDLMNHTEILAMKDVALSASHLLRSIATADWTSPLSGNANIEQFTDLQILPGLPVICNLVQLAHQEPNRPLPLPTKGIHVLTCKAFRGAVFAWLLKPAISLPHLVGGRGDAEKAAYQIASEKFDLVKDVHAALVRELQGLTEDTALKRDYEGLERALRRRISEGVMGRREGIGGQVATMQGA